MSEQYEFRIVAARVKARKNQARLRDDFGVFLEEADALRERAELERIGAYAGVWVERRLVGAWETVRESAGKEPDGD